jgi:hypothetical protein
VIIVCGSDNLPCASGDGTPLNEYRKPQPSGTFIVTFDTDNCGTKEECAQKIESFIGAGNPATNVLIGHSAGADTVILVANNMIDSGRKDQLKSVVLLDPTLTATIGGKWTDLQEMANKVAATVPTFLGDTAQDYDYETGKPILINIPGAISPLANDSYPLLFDSDYPGKLDYSHADLALSVDVSNYIINTFLNPLP